MTSSTKNHTEQRLYIDSPGATNGSHLISFSTPWIAPIFPHGYYTPAATRLNRMPVTSVRLGSAFANWRLTNRTPGPMSPREPDLRR